MGIRKIVIRNFRSIKHIVFNLDRNIYEVQCILGENGSGKSNFMDALNYFYLNLQTDNQESHDIFDKRNPYSQKMEIEILYDFSDLNYNSNMYIDDKLFQLSDYLVNNRLSVRLTQYKNKKIAWSLNDKELRKYLAKVFPIILVDVRFISLQDWSALWDIISDFSISTVKLSEAEIQNKLDEAFVQIYGEKYSKVVKRIDQIFQEENITVNDREYKSRFKNALFTRLGGSEFMSDGNKLPFYSDGLNSLQYLKLLLGVVSSLVDTGWKNPLILLDEPELGLHPQYINDLVLMTQYSIHKKVNIIMATHSTSLVSALIREDINPSINRIFMIDGYSKIERLKDIIDDKYKYLVSSREAECYFSKMLILVEGISEIHLFKNKNLLRLFPKLKKVNFYNYDSNNKMLSIVNPNKMNFNVPYLLIDDMDKILNYSMEKNKMKLSGSQSVNPLKDKEIVERQKYYYYNNGRKKYYTYNLKKRIDGILETDIHHEINSIALSGVHYTTLVSLVKKYCSMYNIITWRTTIEGCLVNENSVNAVIIWLLSWFKADEICKLSHLLMLYAHSRQSQISIVRVLLNGKFDCLLTLDEAQNHKLLDTAKYDAIKDLNVAVGGKAGGWIGQFLDFYFTDILSEYSEEEKKNRFSHDFEEIEDVLQKIDCMIL